MTSKLNKKAALWHSYIDRQTDGRTDRQHAMARPRFAL